jgi:succinoglycan biosynthesis protein ExoA
MTLDEPTASTGPDGPVKVSVLVPVLNEERHVETVVASLQAQESPGGPIEFLFMDGRSTDATRSLLEAAAEDDPRIIVLDNPRRITSAGLNVGLRHARGEFVARMDAHARYPSGYLRIGVERLARGDVASASGAQLAEGSDVWSRRIALALTTHLGVGGAAFRRPVTEEMEVDSGFTGIWRTELIRRHGGWDEPAYPNEDAELAARIRADGGRIVCLPEMAARYTPRSSLRSLATQYWRYGRARARTLARHPNALQPAHLLPPALVLASVSAAIPHRGRPRLDRVALAVYAVATAASAARLVGGHGRDAVSLLVVLPTMHLSWGAGYVYGTLRFGPPARLRPARGAAAQ